MSPRPSETAVRRELYLRIAIVENLGYHVEQTLNGARFHFYLSDPVDDFNQRTGLLAKWKHSERLKDVGDNFSVRIRKRPNTPTFDRLEVAKKERELMEQLEENSEKSLSEGTADLDIRDGSFAISTDASNVDQYWSNILVHLAQIRTVCEVVVSCERPPHANRLVYVITVHLPRFVDPDLRRRIRKGLQDLCPNAPIPHIDHVLSRLDSETTLVESRTPPSWSTSSLKERIEGLFK